MSKIEFERHGGGACLCGPRPLAFLALGIAAVMSSGGCATEKTPPLVMQDAAVIIEEAGVIMRDGGRSDAAASAIDAANAWRDGAAAPACGSGSCNPANAESCGRVTSCVLDVVPMCVLSVGHGVEGYPCSATADCGAGLACFRVGTSSSCRRPCCESGAPSCAVEQRCAMGKRMASGEPTVWGACQPPTACDVLRPLTSCGEGEGCYVVTGDGATDCLVAGSRAVDEPCVQSNDCAPGLVCAGLARRTCVRICAMGAPSCPAMQTCRAYAYSPPGTGVCTVTVSPDAGL